MQTYVELLQHGLKFAALVKCLCVGASTNAISLDEYARHLETEII